MSDNREILDKLYREHGRTPSVVNEVVEAYLAHTENMSDNLPPLPECVLEFITDGALFTADQMRAYAAQAVALERERCAQICETLENGYAGKELEQAAAAIRKG